MRMFAKPAGKIRSLLMVSVLGLAACGATEKVEDVSRVERSDLVPSTTDILRATPKKSERRLAQDKSFSAALNEDANRILAPSGFDAELTVESYMVPNAIVAEISGARAYLSTKITLRNAASGELLVQDVAMTFVTPKDGPVVTDAEALVVAFGEHLKKSMQLR